MKLLHSYCFKTLKIDSHSLAKWIHLQKNYEAACTHGVNHLTRHQAKKLQSIGINPLALLDMEPVLLTGWTADDVAIAFCRESGKPDYYSRTGSTKAASKRTECSDTLVNLLKSEGPMIWSAIIMEMSIRGFGRRLVDRILLELEGPVLEVHEFSNKKTYRLKRP